jgi:hypothetical protein
LDSAPDFNYDLFGRQKIAQSYTIFDSSHRYQMNDDFSDITAESATVTYNANQSTCLLNVTTTSGSKVYRESQKVFPYQPGKSLQVMQTFVMAEQQDNLRQRVGYFSRQNGVYLELEGSNLYLVKRSYISGSVVNTRIPQNEWNVDRLDGDGGSGYTLDISKAQILFFEFEWLGVGTVRAGFAINGNFIVVHEFNHANIIDSVYMTTASLPVRYEIEALAALSSPASMKQICVSVMSNGGFDRKTESWSAVRSTPVTVGTDFYPVVAIRLASGRTDSVVLPSNINVLPTSQDNFQWALIKNPTSVSNGSWVTHSTNNVEYNIGATTMSGGTIVRTGFLAGSNQSTTTADVAGLNDFDLQLGRTNADSPTSDVLVLAARHLTGTGPLVGSLGWFDLI